jgi:hypothetical protein
MVGAPRNRGAFERGQTLRGKIRAILLAHPPLLPPLTAKQISGLLKISPMPSDRTIQWHVQAIQTEHKQANVALGAIHSVEQVEQTGTHGNPIRNGDAMAAPIRLFARGK